ncbi:MAG: type II secretion system F family protein [Planctomycetia bacterium]|nr:type II secretion system F family protein [Planctomycetia bacterium]
MSTVTIEQLVALNDEIASLVRGGMPLELGLRELGEDSAGALSQITQALASRMSKGATLAEALDGERQRLPPSYRVVVEAGIRSGRLSAALEAISNYARELIELRRQISLALVYPLIVVMLAYVLFVVFVADVVARLHETYEVFRIRMPWMLTVIARATEWAAEWWWVFPLAMVALVAWWAMTGGARVLAFSGISQPLAWVPYVGRICRQFRYANFAELLALMIEHEVPLPEGLRLAADATGDAQLRRAGRNLADAVERGSLPADLSGRRHGFPPFLYWVLSCGQSGEGLVRLLRHAATVYRRQSSNLSRWFRTLFPFTVAMVIGGGVTALYGLTLIGPLAQFWRDLGLP